LSTLASRSVLTPAYLPNPADREYIPDRYTVSVMTDLPGPPVPPIRSLRVIVGTLTVSLVMFAVVLFLVLPNGHYPPIWVPWGLGGLAVLSHLLCRKVGFTIKPVPSGTLPGEAMAMALAAFRTSTIVRFALSELVAIVALTLSFAVAPATWMTYLIGLVLALILLWVNAWPHAAVISKAQQQLDRDGGESFLPDALLGLAPGTASSGVIRT